MVSARFVILFVSLVLISSLRFMNYIIFLAFYLIIFVIIFLVFVVVIIFLIFIFLFFIFIRLAGRTGPWLLVSRTMDLIR